MHFVLFIAALFLYAIQFALMLLLGGLAASTAFALLNDPPAMVIISAFLIGFVAIPVIDNSIDWE